MSRFDELKTKGWANLSAAERAEYSELKTASEVLKGEKTVPLSDVQRMIAEEVAKATAGLKREKEGLEKQVFGGWKEVEPEKERQYKARLRLWRPDTDQDYGVIVDWKYLKSVFDEDTRRYDKAIYKITCLYNDGSKKDYEIPLIDFSKIQDFEIVDIISKETKELVKVHGEVFRSRKTKDGYTMPEAERTSIAVPLEERVENTICTVKRPNGQEIILNANRLNQ